MAGRSQLSNVIPLRSVTDEQVVVGLSGLMQLVRKFLSTTASHTDEIDESPTADRPDCQRGFNVKAAGDPGCSDGMASTPTGSALSDEFMGFAVEMIAMN